MFCYVLYNVSLLFFVTSYSKVALWTNCYAGKMFVVKMLMAKMFMVKLPRTGGHGAGYQENDIF